MRSNPYQVLGTNPVIMRGRDDFFNRLTRHLIKPTPDHVCVVGPKLIGKTVILKHLADHFSTDTKYYIAALYWDLGHGTPRSDADFKRQFGMKVQKTLRSIRPDLASELGGADSDDIGENLETVFSILEEEGQRVLAVLDGFDRILAGAIISRNLWDYLRDLAHKSSLRFVTGSRRRLQDLCKTEASRTSDFWEIFYDSPLEVGPFTETDLEEILAPFSKVNISFDTSSRKEIMNWTGGTPILAAAMLSRLYDQTPNGATLSNTDINKLGKNVLEECRDILGGLWEDCNSDMQDNLAALAEQGKDLLRSEIPPLRLKALQKRGFVSVSGNRVKSSCRIIQQYASLQKSKVENIRRLFGSRKKFEGNIRALLELRLSQINDNNDVDQKLYHYVERAVRDLQPEPELAINSMRGVADYALRLVWNAELPKNNLIPSAWVQQWKYNGENIRDEIAEGKVPLSLTGKCRLLQLMTGTQKSKAVTKFITKPTYLLIDHLQSVGHFGQHIEGNPVTLSFAASVCFTVIALCESLSTDFGRAVSSEAPGKKDDQKLLR